MTGPAFDDDPPRVTVIYRSWFQVEGSDPHKCWMESETEQKAREISMANAKVAKKKLDDLGLLGTLVTCWTEKVVTRTMITKEPKKVFAEL